MRKIFLFFIISNYCYGVTVLLDPGHGGAFDGCVSFSKKLLEKDITLDIAHRIGALLKKRNITPVYSRTTDRHFNKQLDKNTHFNPDAITDAQEKVFYTHHLTTDLTERSKIIKDQKPDIVISLHANSGSKAMRGFELFIPFEKKFSTRSYILAAYIHQALAHNTEQDWLGTMGNLNIRDRGIRQARFNVLRNLSCPAVLIELDYITHSEVEKNFLSTAYKQKLAQIIADAIIAYIQESKKI
ncbi:MAG: N-acetylmuramoyl-L-alanine amidase [Candidatus Babeliaceae bacterium]